MNTRKALKAYILIFTVLLCSCEKTVYIDRVEYEYVLDTLLVDGENTSEYEIKIISSQRGSDYKSLTEAFEQLDEGRFILYLKDSLYEESVTTNLDVKAGWIIKGRGMNCTKVVFYDENPASHYYNLNIVGDSRIYDLHLISIQTSQSNHYCIHMDDPTVPNLQFRCENVMMETVFEDDDVLPNTNNLLALGIGTWDNWNLIFKNCIIKCDERVTLADYGFGAVNFHNNDGAAGTTVFENCKIVSNGNAILIRDFRHNYDNNDRLKDRLTLKNCEISGYIVGYNHQDGKNGFWFDVSNTTATGLLDMNYLADSGYSSYDYNSIPQLSSVRYLENIGEEKLLAGTLVDVVFNEKDYYWNTKETIPMPIGFKSSNSNPNGVLLVDAYAKHSCHVLLHGNGQIAESYEIMCNPGDYISCKGGAIIKSDVPTNCIYLGNRIIRLK